MTEALNTDTWLDISDEEWREYVFPGRETIRIEGPSRLLVVSKPNGDSHRVLTKDGYSWYIPRGWLGIFWKADPPFSF